MMPENIVIIIKQLKILTLLLFNHKYKSKTRRESDQWQTVDAGFVDLTVEIPGLTGCAYCAGIAGRSTELA